MDKINNYENPEKRLDFENKAVNLQTKEMPSPTLPPSVYKEELEKWEKGGTFCAKHNREMEEKQSIAEEAIKIVKGHRNNDYGSATESFDRIAKMSSLLCNKEFTALDCVRILKAVKLVRESYKHKEDNLIDLIGYTEIENQIINNEK